MATVKIGTIQSLGSVESYTVNVDDRQTKVNVLDGAVVQDMGYFDEGMSFSFSTTFLDADFAKILTIWKNRTRFVFTDPAGKEWQSCRLVLKTWQPVSRFEKMAYKISCEIWRV